MPLTPLPIALPDEVGLSGAGLATLDAALQAHIDAGTIAGAVMIVARQGRVCHQAALGRRDVASDAPARIDHLFRIFSMTKPITAAAMMSLWDEGRWTLDDPIALHLPEFAGVEVCAGKDGEGRMVLEAPQRPPTLRDLFTHTAGLSYGTRLSDPNDPVDAAYQAAGVWDARDLADMVTRLAPLPLAYHPGTSWRYSLGMDVEGAIIERLTGQTLAAVMKQRLFDPLGMTETRFFTPPADRARLATLYLKSPGQPLTELDNPMFADASREPPLAWGGAGLVSTASDYVRFAAMLLGRGSLDGKRVLSDAAVDLMLKNHLSQALIERGFVMGHQRIGPGRGFALNGSVFTDPALAGVAVGRGTYQWDGAAGTWFWIDPAYDLLCVGMTQTMSYTAPALQAEMQALLGRLLVDAPA